MLGASATYLVDYVDGLGAQGAGATGRIAAANAMLMVNVCMGYTINGNVMNHALHERLAPLLPLPKGARPGAAGGAGGGGGGTSGHGGRPVVGRVAWLCVTCVTLGGSFLLSNIVPSLGNLLSVLGATCGYTLTFLFPAVFSLRLLRRGMSMAVVAVHACVVVAAAFAIVVGTYVTVRALGEGIGDDLQAGLFRC